MLSDETCDCGVCNTCNGFGDDMVADETGTMIIEILDPDKLKILDGLAKILPPMNVKEVVMVNALAISSGIVKIAAKHKPNNPKLWASCIAAAKRKFDVFPSAYANGFASRLYKKKGGTWRTVKGGKKK